MNKSLIFSEFEPFSENELLEYGKSNDLVIVAAGKGTRLGYHLPKLLYPVMNGTILDHILGTFKNSFAKVILVVSPQGEEPILKFLQKNYSDLQFQLVIQDQPLGMAHAIFKALPKLESRNAMLVWGDQASIRRRTVLRVTKAMKNREGEACFILPTQIVENPYIHFVRNQDNQIMQVLQKREGDSMPLRGETDCGFFCFQKDLLKRISKFESIGAQTKEYNFLPLLAKANELGGSTTLRTLEEVELMGVNTSADAKNIEDSWKTRGQHD